MEQKRWWQSEWFQSLCDGAGDIIGAIVNGLLELLVSLIANIDF
jgi:hypothetical protein